MENKCCEKCKDKNCSGCCERCNQSIPFNSGCLLLFSNQTKFIKTAKDHYGICLACVKIYDAFHKIELLEKRKKKRKKQS